jgi:hypothetical protein
MATLQQSSTSRILMAVAKAHGSPVRHHTPSGMPFATHMIDHGASIVIVSDQLAEQCPFNSPLYTRNTICQ